VLAADPERQREEFENLKFPPVRLTREQRLFVESALPTICKRGHWNYIEGAAGEDHVHVILQSPFDPQTIRRLLKRWLGQELSHQWPPPDGATWWAEDGSIRWISDERYFHNATKYVHDQRTTPAPGTPDETFIFNLRVD
jgi:REP element-mobilizing transposase RayT